MQQSDIITRLREDHGFSDVTTYSDAKLVYLISLALRKISEYYPKLVRDYINTVVDQTRYQITKSDLIGLKEVFYSNSAEGAASGNLGSTFGLSSQFTSIMSMEIAAHLTPYGAEIVGHDSFDLIPTPTEVTKVYYEYKAIRTITELPDIFEEDIYALITNSVATDRFRKANSQNGASGNPYKFDRRGNVTEEASTTVSTTQKTLEIEHKSIIENIKRKAMMLK